MKIIKKSLAILVILILFIQGLAGNVKAVNYSKTTGSLTITRYGKYTDSTGTNTKKAVEGAKFSIYKVDSDTESTDIPADSVAVRTLTTGEDGIVKFENLELGRYLVVEDEVPSNVKDKVVNFLVDIPMTNDTGDDLIYDVSVSPKTESSYGTVTLIKKGINDEKLEGVKFLLQKKFGSTWKDFPSTDLATLSTDTDGKIVVDGFSEGTYRFVEIELGNNKEYILDNNTGYEFSVSFDADKNPVISPDSTIEIINEKPTITKSISKIEKSENNTNTISGGTTSADKGDTISYKITTDIPSKISELNIYKISDEINENVKMDYSTFKVYGVKEDSTKVEIGVNDYTLDNSVENKFDISFSNAKLAEYKKIEVTYDAKLEDNLIAIQNGYSNTAKLTYSSIVKEAYDGTQNVDTTADTTDNATVKVGGFNIEKHAKTSTGKLLKGAEFKLATSIENAEQENFIKDTNGNEIVLTTDANGLASYYGLAFGEYQLVETKAPTDDEGNSYKLLEKPQTITIDENTYYSATPIIVINKTPTVLPFTGGIGAIIFMVVGATALTGVVLLRKKNNGKH